MLEQLEALPELDPQVSPWFGLRDSLLAATSAGHLAILEPEELDIQIDVVEAPEAPASDAWQVAQTPLDVRNTERHHVPAELLDPDGISTQKLRRPPWADTMER